MWGSLLVPCSAKSISTVPFPSGKSRSMPGKKSSGSSRPRKRTSIGSSGNRSDMSIPANAKLNGITPVMVDVPARFFILIRVSVMRWSRYSTFPFHSTSLTSPLHSVLISGASKVPVIFTFAVVTISGDFSFNGRCTARSPRSDWNWSGVVLVQLIPYPWKFNSLTSPVIEIWCGCRLPLPLSFARPETVPRKGGVSPENKVTTSAMPSSDTDISTANWCAAAFCVENEASPWSV